MSPRSFPAGRRRRFAAAPPPNPPPGVPLAFSVWWGLLTALVIYAAGTAIRIRAEERLLREAFGDDFEAYRRYVPAVIPRWKT